MERDVVVVCSGHTFHYLRGGSVERVCLRVQRCAWEAILSE